MDTIVLSGSGNRVVYFRPLGCDRARFETQRNPNPGLKEGAMDKKKIKKVMTGLTLSGLVAGLGAMSAGCSSTSCGKSSCGEGSCGSAGQDKTEDKAQTSCGKGSCG